VDVPVYIFMKLSRSPLFQSFSEFFMAVMIADSLELGGYCVVFWAPAWMERREERRRGRRNRVLVRLAMSVSFVLILLN